MNNSNSIQRKEEIFDLKVFDAEALKHSVALLKGEFAIAIEEYLEDAAHYIQNIKDGVENGDSEQAARGSHPLKSNSQGFGLTSVSKIAEAINIEARAGNINSLEPLLQQLNKAFYYAEEKLRETVKHIER